ncbi:PLC-like phosphodiesterase [Lasiosphaeria miniovina]|uniref:PLC-like phosphodiesterase n=1 Tax=Lasiosphaeria miniovina TaxID=1954250 RepID=A0AA40B6C4_9PEZI|nr:PLC-like phosphodiesterase [Lasiosphaeria miniovina]KAK0728551.1 PLC-like phosphodiesterase [Lasiosphaeria miniovina]
MASRSLRRFGCLLWALGLSARVARCQASADTTSSGLTVLTGTKAGESQSETTSEAKTPTGSYQTFSTTITLATTSLSSALETTIAANGTVSTSTVAPPEQTVTYLTGSVPTSSPAAGNVSTTVESPAPKPTNTRPCNNYPEFCERKYSNITVVGCHNSPFVRPGSAAANQQYTVVDQLNDGVRFLQAQIQWPKNGSVPHFCHTTCDLFDAGPITDWLTTVKDWVAAHPYDVVTILLGNGNYSTPAHYVPFIESTGLLQYVYTPPVVPMSVDSWPTLASMILSGQRVVMLLDYMADQKAYPWLMDEFSQMWETPFDPTNQTFPCTVQRPPDLAPANARKRLYLMNHNLNVEVSLLGASVLVPAVSQLNQTNNATGYGSLGAAAAGCDADWGRPPTVLNVDYYNYGGFPGSVFEVAARMNNVTYNRPCCGKSSAAARVPAAAVSPLLKQYPVS